MTDRAPLTVGIVGAGTMGAGIAQVCLQAGHDVLLHDVDHEAIERGRGRISEALNRLTDKGRLPGDDRDRMLAALRDAHSLHELAADSDVVVEAALEDLGLKAEVFRALGDGSGANTILATNTSALSVEQIAAASGVPDRVLGLHFFNPAPLMPLVEVVVGDQTDRAIARRAVDFAHGVGKEPV